jgi:hypothetical protein
MRIVRGTLTLLVVVLCCAALAASSAAQTTKVQHVTIFGDSVASALNWDSTARDVLEQGNRVTFDLAPCRRLWTPGCITPPPPSMLQDILHMRRNVGPTVVALVGYNDDPNTFAEGLGRTLKALRRYGVQHVLWLTLRQVYPVYAQTNAAIRAAAKKRPWMKVVDWNSYSEGHSTWFASDGIHLSAEGAVEFAIYVHQTLKRDGLTGPPKVPPPGIW